MTYSLGDLPVGVQAFVTAWWDVNLNGILSSEDYWRRFPVFTTQSGQTFLDLEFIRKYGANGLFPSLIMWLLGY